MNTEEKRRVAFHESGHALVALTVPTGKPVHNISIIPRGVAAPGYTLPVAEAVLCHD
jgi:cell division protease FtsH